MNRMKNGIFFTYIALAINTLSGFLLTPFMIRSLGETEYALYQLIVSISGYLTVVNIGTGRAMTRFVSMYKATAREEEIDNYISVNLFITCLLTIVVAVAGIFISVNIGGWFPNLTKSFAYDVLARNMCICVVINVMITFVANAFEGLLQAYGYIDKINQCLALKLAIRFTMIFLLLQLGFVSLPMA